MGLIIVPVLTVLASIVLRWITVVELIARLRWKEQQQRVHICYVVALARALPHGCRLDEIGADGSELHLVMTHAAKLAERS
jgi:hypothetical protein